MESKSAGYRTFKEIEADMGLFGQFYADSFPKDEINKYTIEQNNPLKIAWDIFIMIVLLFIVVVIPVRIAFKNDEH